jgi:hypothetical protein
MDSITIMEKTRGKKEAVKIKVSKSSQKYDKEYKILSKPQRMKIQNIF